MPSKKFKQSKELTDIISRHGWQLYDVTLPDDRHEALTFEELQDMQPVNDFEFDRQYFLVPQPKKGETLRQAYSVTKGLGPAIVLPSIEDHVDMNGEGPLVRDGKLIQNWSYRTAASFRNSRNISGL